MMAAVAKILAFVGEHFDLLEMLYDLIVEKRVEKTKIVEQLKKLQIESSDAQFEAELTDRQG